MTVLSIQNFLSIKNAEIRLSRINILIGPQGQGKSVISKLVYYFKCFPAYIIDSAIEDHDKKEFDSSCIERFEGIFPAYAWENKSFLIVYEAEGHKITIENLLVGKRFKLKLSYTNSIKRALSVGRTGARKFEGFTFENRLQHDYGFTRRVETRRAVMQAFTKGLDAPRFEELYFIPAGRSFFSNLQKNLFSFISSNIPIDFFLKEFGSIYERTRELRFHAKDLRSRPKSVERLFESLLLGKYLYDKSEDWIEGVQGRVRLSNSSSGQQEVLPMALMLSTWPYVNGRTVQRSFVIEEPEAHLFPLAQGQVVSLIAAASNSSEKVGDFLVTTHSPYILSALNVLIQAGNTLRSMEGPDYSAVFDIVSEDQVVDFKDVSAYLVNAGKVVSIMDDEAKLIKAQAIDSISTHFSETFERLVEMEFIQDVYGGDDDEEKWIDLI